MKRIWRFRWHHRQRKRKNFLAAISFMNPALVFMATSLRRTLVRLFHCTANAGFYFLLSKRRTAMLVPESTMVH